MGRRQKGATSLSVQAHEQLLGGRFVMEVEASVDNLDLEVVPSHQPVRRCVASCAL